MAAELKAAGSDKVLRHKSVLREYVEIILTAVLIALFIRAYVVQAFKIPSGSMIPTLLVGDYLFVNKFIYGTPIPLTDKTVLVLRKPARGDIIVFKYPEDPKRDFIKRVVAVGGDEVKVVNKAVYINGQLQPALFAQYTDMDLRPAEVSPRDNFGPKKVPEGKLFVMGDNRDNSHDSRWWGYVDEREVRGLAFVIYWSWDSEQSKPRLGRLGSLVK